MRVGLLKACRQLLPVTSGQDGATEVPRGQGSWNDDQWRPALSQAEEYPAHDFESECDKKGDREA